MQLNRNSAVFKKTTFFTDSILGSGTEDEDDDDASNSSSVLQHKHHSHLSSGHLETNNNSLSHSDVSVSLGQVSVLIGIQNRESIDCDVFFVNILI